MQCVKLMPGENIKELVLLEMLLIVRLMINMATILMLVTKNQPSEEELVGR